MRWDIKSVQGKWRNVKEALKKKKTEALKITREHSTGKGVNALRLTIEKGEVKKKSVNLHDYAELCKMKLSKN